MSKKRNKKKKLPQKQNSNKQAINRFKGLLYGALKEIGQEKHFHLLKHSELHRLFLNTIQVIRPCAKFGFNIASKELQKINDHIQHYLRKPLVPLGENILSTNAYSCLYAFVYIREQIIQDEERRLFLKEHFKIDIDLHDESQDIMRFLHGAYLKAIIALGNPRQKYYSYDNYFIKQDVNQLGRFESPYISSFPAKSKMVLIHGKYRPVFRLLVPYANGGVRNLSISTDLLGDFYRGTESKIDLFVQSHALNRFQERLDVLGPSALNFEFWMNTCQITEFVFYKNYLLLPVLIQEIRVGYFLAHLVGDELVFRTFLFITHSCTPEGDKLKEITGLQKNDIKYWHIDRLSTIIEAEKYPKLQELFGEAGIAELLGFREDFCNSDDMPNINIGGLMTYIEQGKKEIEEDHHMESTFQLEELV